MRPMAVGVITGGNPVEALHRVRALGLECCQLSMPGREWFKEPALSELKAAIAETGVEIAAFFCGFDGERYDDIPTIRRTVGLINPETRPARLAQVLQNSDDMAALGAPALCAHIGFIPEDRSQQEYWKIVATVAIICARCATHDQVFGLETGQESASALSQFIQDVGRPNLKVNFDPANMLLYGSGKPIEAISVLRPHVISIHCKDGRWPTMPDQLGEEVPFGEGEVDAPALLHYLSETGFTGPLIIEREISGEKQQQDVLRARDLIESLR